MRTTILTALAAATLAVPAAAAPRNPDAELAKLLDGRVPGKPVNCITPSTVQSSEIITGQAIVYRAGSTLYVNRPRGGADSLRRDDILFTDIRGGQLCSIDTVKLIDRGSRFQRSFVTLGEFVPYRKPKTH